MTALFPDVEYASGSKCGVCGGGMNEGEGTAPSMLSATEPRGDNIRDGGEAIDIVA